MYFWKFLEGQGWSPDHPEPIAPFPHSGLSCSSVNNKSMTVCAMYSIFVKYIQKIFEKKQEWSQSQSLLWAQVSQFTCVLYNSIIIFIFHNSMGREDCGI